MGQVVHRKLLAFVILSKRKYKNSVILDYKKRSKAEEFGLSINTFRKYVNACIENGWAYQDSHGHLHFIKLRKILSQFYKKSELNFGWYDILEKEGYENKFKNILELVELCLIDENVRKKQEFNIRARDLTGNRRQTKKAIKILRQDIMNEWSPIKNPDCKVTSAEIQSKASSKHLKRAITSCRHTGKILSVSNAKANQLLKKRNEFFKTKKRQFFIDGCNDYVFDFLQENFPKATVYPLISIGKTKICFGTEIMHNKEREKLLLDFDSNTEIGRLINFHDKGEIEVCGLIKQIKAEKGKPKKFRPFTNNNFPIFTNKELNNSLKELIYSYSKSIENKNPDTKRA